MDPGTTTTPSEQALEVAKELNKSFGKCLEVIGPAIKYPKEITPNPTHKEKSQTKLINQCISDFMFQAKRLEVFFTEKKTQQGLEETPKDIEDEINALEVELLEKNELIEKYTAFLHGWKAKFHQLDEKLLP